MLTTRMTKASNRASSRVGGECAVCLCYVALVRSQGMHMVGEKTQWNVYR